MSKAVRVDRWKLLWTIAIVSFFGGAVVSVFSGDEAMNATAAETTGEQQAQQAPPAKAEAPAKDPVIERTDEGCLADSATLEDLKRQKRELEARQKDLAARETELKAREQALSDEIRKLAEAREEIDRIDGNRKAEAEAKVAKLVETIESMNPKAAAGLVASIDESLAVQAMTRLTTAKLAKMMNVMDPARSSRLSEILAGVTRAKRATAGKPSSANTASDPAAGVTSGRNPDPAKGGESNDGKSHEQQQASNRSTGRG